MNDMKLSVPRKQAIRPNEGVLANLKQLNLDGERELEPVLVRA
jgi:hypothetical protein